MPIKITSITLRALCLAVLEGILFWGNFLVAQNQNHNPANRISLVFEAHSSSRLWDGGIWTSVGGRKNRHEIGFHFPNFIDPNSLAIGGHYRYYFESAAPFANPYLAIQAVPFHRIDVVAVGSGEEIGGMQQGIYGQLGIDYRIKSGCSGFFALGFGYGWLQFNDPTLEPWQAYHQDLTLGIKYDLILKGQRNPINLLPEKYKDRSRWLLNYRAKWSSQSSIIGSNPGTSPWLHQITAEYRVLNWLRIQGGIQLGAVQNDPDNNPFRFQGAGLGLKLHTYQKGKWAFFHDVALYQIQVSRLNLVQTRFLLGNSIEYQMLPDLFFHLGETMSFQDRFSTLEFHSGLTLALGREMFR